MIIAKNKQAYFDYDILEKFEAGIILEGWEVKSIKAKMFSLGDSYVKISELGVFVVNMHVARWKTQSPTEHIVEDREKKLLLNKDEIEKLVRYRKSAGTTVLVLSVHLVRNKIKVEIGVGRGRKKYDKRELLKKREIQRDIDSRGVR